MEVDRLRVQFKIPGPPQAKARARFRVIGLKETNPAKGKGKKFIVKTYTPEQTVSYENLIEMEFRRQCGNVRFPDDAMLDMRVFSYYKIPKSTSKKKRELMLAKIIRPIVKPDADNVCKAVCDSLNKIAYKDDSRIVDLMFRKFYSDVPRVEVIIQTIN